MNATSDSTDFNNIVTDIQHYGAAGYFLQFKNHFSFSRHHLVKHEEAIICLTALGTD